MNQRSLLRALLVGLMVLGSKPLPTASGQDLTATAKGLAQEAKAIQVPPRGKVKILDFDQEGELSESQVTHAGAVLLQLPTVAAPYSLKVTSKNKNGFGRTLPIFVPEALILDEAFVTLKKFGEDQLASGRGLVLLTVPVDAPATQRYVLVYTRADLVGQMLPNHDEDFINRRRVRANGGGGFYLRRAGMGNVEVEVTSPK